jgi:hypothetical protein
MPRSFSNEDYQVSKFLNNVSLISPETVLSRNNLFSVNFFVLGSVQNVTVPALASLSEVDFPAGGSAVFIASGAAAHTITPAGGVTINGSVSALTFSATPYNTQITLIRIDDNNWAAVKTVASAGGSGDAFTVLASVADTTPDYLFGKLIAAAGVSLSITSPGGDENVQIATTGDGPITINAQTISYQAVLADANQIVSMTVAGANTFTVPANATVAFPIGSRLSVLQLGAGQTTVTPAGGVTINEAVGDLLLQQYQCLTLLKTGTNTWAVIGDLFSTNDQHNFSKNQSVAQVTLADAATIATDCSLSNNFTVTLGGNRTLGAPTNPTAGMVCNWEIKQDATGSRTLAFNAVFLFAGGVDPVASTTANAIDFMSGYYDGASWLCSYQKAFA